MDKTVISQLEHEGESQDKVTVVAINNDGHPTPEQTEVGADDKVIEGPETSTPEVQKQTALVAPIRLQNQTIGTINLVETENQRQWSDLELLLVQTIADQVGQAAENLRLFEETRHRAGREQTLRQVTEHMRSATNLDELIQIAAKELGEHLSADYAVVELGLQDQKTEQNGRDLDGSN